MKRRFLAIALLLVIFVAGWYLWESFIRSTGYDDFDDAFWEEFDAQQIILSMDKLRDSGQFSYFVRDEGESVYDESLYWPAEGKEESSHVMAISNYSEPHDDSSYHYIRWHRHGSFSPPSAKDVPNKYLYTFYLSTPDGDITYSGYGSSRRECKDKMRENLLWLMSLC